MVIGCGTCGTCGTTKNRAGSREPGAAMSETDILAALDGWLGGGEAPPAHLTKPGVAQSPQEQVRTETTVSNLVVTSPVTTVSTPDGRPALLKKQVKDREGYAWTDNEAARCEARAQAFMAKGIPVQSADRLACSLMRRDHQLDDRRSCAECVSFHAGHCRQSITPIGETTIYTLHRCKGFQR